MAHVHMRRLWSVGSHGRIGYLNLLMLILALAWLGVIGRTQGPEADDFKQYWQAAVNLQNNGDPYATTPDPTTGSAIRRDVAAYPYPPLLAYAIRPLGSLVEPTARWVWFGMNSALLACFIGLCMWVSGSQVARRYWGVTVLATLMAPPTRLALQLGQVSIVLALLVVL